MLQFLLIFQINIIKRNNISRLEEKLNNRINIKSFEENLILKLKNSNLAYPNTFMFKIFRLIIFISRLEKYYSISRFILHLHAVIKIHDAIIWMNNIKIILRHQIYFKFYIFFLNKIRKFYILYRNPESNKINFNKDVTKKI